MVVTAAMLALIAEAGENVLTLIEDVDEASFGRSRITRLEVQRQLMDLANALASLDVAAHAAMPEIDWPGWRATAVALSGSAVDAASTAWFAARSLVPATLMWLQVYRRSAPELFEFRSP